MKHRSRNWKVALAGCSCAALIVAPSVAASAGTHATAPRTLQPHKALVQLPVVMNYLAQGAQAGFYYADQLGLYRKAGLAVTISQGVGSQVTAAQVATGKFDVGFADGPTTMEAIAKGADDVILAPILEVNSGAFISLKKSGITSIKQFIGKTIGLATGTVAAAVVPIVLKNDQIAQSRVHILAVSNQTPPLPLLESGQINVYEGAVDLQAIQLKNEGASINVMPLPTVGGGFLGTSIIANRTYFAHHKRIVDEFVAASLQGWMDARENPNAAALSILRQVPTAGTTSLLEAETRADISLLCAPGATKLGVEPSKIQAFTYNVMRSNYFIPENVPVTHYFDGSAIPKNGPTCSAG